ncbi:class II glutamine amidotransferase [Streptomyces chartreusis]|uniref:Class II glutamine amidotransferase n=1 Tax=Streptomyces chartreusis TaxID=1969 RepID=A0A7H8TJB7_STRCX|nr:class II glutamine amidotransferase [Streptomyces chartreusis]QKZ23424.1 class II glutamine amidotransferase [Streptomyces chartreusis]
MCRLMGVVTRAPLPLTEALSDLAAPFTELSREHRDGWGIAAWPGQGTGLHIVKDTEPAFDTRRWDHTLMGTLTDTALLHLRLASPDLPVVSGNTHPFTVGTLAFAHNGFFTPYDALDELIDADLLAGAAGNTDSERYFLRVLTLLREENPVDALAHAAAEIRARTSFASLNCLLLTEQALYAYSDEDPDSEVSRRRGPDFFQLRYRVDEDRVVVASSGVPQPDGDWHVLPYRRVLEIHRSSLRVSVHRVAHALVKQI